MLSERYSFFGLSDIGTTRSNNEDVWVALPEMGFFAVADGMGGHRGGEIAAKEALEQVCSHLQTTRTQTNPVHSLQAAIEKANRWVYEKSRLTKALNGMGTTLCCLSWTGKSVIYAHVGDSRVYLFRSKKLYQLTEDHSLLAKWLSYGQIAEKCKTPYPYKNVITRAIGTAKAVEAEIESISFERGDLFVLCSDGLSDVLPLSDMEKILESAVSLQESAERLIERAKIKGSHDNITVLLCKESI